jgi:hypothetical protein
MAEKGCLGENFDIEERRYRLKWHDRELVEPIEPARRVDVAQWESENQPPRQRPDRAGPGSAAAPGAATDHMVTTVDGLKKRIQVCLGPRLACRGHEHERQVGALQPSLQGLARAVFLTNRYDSTFDRSAQRSDQFREGLHHARGAFGWQVGEHHDPDSRVRQ